MYSDILVALDGSALAGKALGPAADLARICGARLRLLRIATDHASQDSVRQEIEARAHARGLGPPEFDVVVREAASPAEGIAAAAGEREKTLLCMASHGRSGIGHALLGSVAEEVLRSMTRPVVLVGPHAGERLAPPPAEVVAALDGSALAEAILPAATNVAALLGRPLRLVQVVSPTDLAAANIPAGDISEDAYLHNVAAGLGTDGAVWDVLHGDSPSEAIVETARTLPAALVALTTHGRTGLARVAAGSVAARIVRESPCPVLVLRPPDL